MKTLPVYLTLFALVACNNSFRVPQPTGQIGGNGSGPSVEDPVVDTSKSKAFYFSNNAIYQLNPTTSTASSVATYGNDYLYPEAQGYGDSITDPDTNIFYFNTYNSTSSNDELVEFNSATNTLSLTDANLQNDSYSKVSGNALLIHNWNGVHDEHTVYTGNNAPGVSADSYYGLDGSTLSTQGGFHTLSLGKGFFVKVNQGSQPNTYILLKTYPTSSPTYEAIVHPGSLNWIHSPVTSTNGAVFRARGTPTTVMHLRYDNNNLSQILSADEIMGPFPIMGGGFLALTLNTSTSEVTAYNINETTGATTQIATYTTETAGNFGSFHDHIWDNFLLLGSSDKSAFYLMTEWGSTIYRISNGTITPHLYGDSISNVKMFMNNDRLHALTNSNIVEIALSPGVASHSADLSTENRVLSAICLNKGYPLSCQAQINGGSFTYPEVYTVPLTNAVNGILAVTVEGASEEFNVVVKNQSITVNSTKNIYLDNLLNDSLRINKAIMSWDPIP